MPRKRILGLPDFAKGSGAVVIAIMGVLWTIAAILYKQHWIFAALGVFITIRGTMRAIENAKEPKQKKVKVRHYVKEQFSAVGAQNKSKKRK